MLHCARQCFHSVCVVDAVCAAPWLIEEHHLTPLNLGLASTGIGIAEIMTEVVAIVIGSRWGLSFRLLACLLRCL